MKKSVKSRSAKVLRANNPLVRAYHEAGHALIAKHNGWRVKFVSIEADLDGRKFGTPDRWGAIHMVREPKLLLLKRAEKIRAGQKDHRSDEWLQRQFRFLQIAVRRYAQFAMGGMAATAIYEERGQVRFAKDFTYGASKDYQNALAVASCLYEEERAKRFVCNAMVSATKQLLKPKRWVAVERVAKRLVKQRTLNGNELNAIVADSTNPKSTTGGIKP